MGNMKVHQFARELWEHELTLGCKRLRPLAPKLPNTETFDLKSFIKPQTSPPKSDDNNNKDHSPSPHTQVETLPGGTRWNPTQEQIGILEMLYRGGMRTPNAQQIEQITVQLGKYGKIEGKNVFYWFQNHKARERQKQKRNTRALSHNPSITRTHTTLETKITRGGVVGVEVERDGEDSPYKKCRRWVFECLEDQSRCKEEEKEEEHRTLEFFPLHPEGK